MKNGTYDLKQVDQLVKEIALQILKDDSTASRTKAQIIRLQGDLGTGKTTFAKAFAKALGIQNHITSPTFVIVKQYNVPQRGERDKQKSGFKQLIHIDAYRMDTKEDIETLNIEEFLNDPSNIVLIEWPEKLGKLIPKNSITIKIDHKDITTRNIQISL
ncbi:MAG: tRNA (adenosine(37)-N6)-threonylcarbamoyltransferase complex ATPase subunit type 1 TsaE [Parcubacteria group bacterium]